MELILQLRQEFDENISNLCGVEEKCDVLSNWVQILFKLLTDRMSQHYGVFEDHVHQTEEVDVVVNDLRVTEERDRVKVDEGLTLAEQDVPEPPAVQDELDPQDTKQNSADRDTEGEVHQELLVKQLQNKPREENMSENQMPDDKYPSRQFVDVATQCTSSELYMISVGIGTENPTMNCDQTQIKNEDSKAKKGNNLSSPNETMNMSCEDKTKIESPIIKFTPLDKSDKVIDLPPPHETSTSCEAMTHIVESSIIHHAHLNYVATMRDVIELPPPQEISTRCEETATLELCKILPPPPGCGPATEPENETNLASPTNKTSKNHADTVKKESSKIHPDPCLVMPTSANCTPLLSPITESNYVRPSHQKQVVTNVLNSQDKNLSNLHVNNHEASFDSDSSSTKKHPTFSNAQKKAWRKKKARYERTCYSSTSSNGEVKLRQKWRAHRDAPQHVTTKRKLLTRMSKHPSKAQDKDGSVWIVAKAMNLKITNRNDTGVLQIRQVSNDPPCSVQKETIGLLVLNKFNLPYCLKKSNQLCIN